MLLDAAGVDAAMGVCVGFVLQFVAVLHSAPDVVQAGSLADELVGGVTAARAPAARIAPGAL